jgi:hypothetical protein
VFKINNHDYVYSIQLVTPDQTLQVPHTAHVTTQPGVAVEDTVFSGQPVVLVKDIEVC